MNRQIRFRAWDAIAEIMLEEDHDGMMIQMNSGKPGWYSDEGNFIEAQEMILMQYTGLKCKHKNDLYDGDLMQVHSKGPIHEIYWSEGEDGWRLRLALGKSGCCKINTNLYYRIGNIYQNPDLLATEGEKA